MRIIDSMTPDRQFLSLEFFPPKEREAWPAFFRTVDRLTRLQPLFASVTYGAGGSTHRDSLEIATRLQGEHGLETLSHLTCIGASREGLLRFLDALTAAGVDNVLALRGDPPKDADAEFSACGTLRYASDLVAFIRESRPEIGISVAGYPEPHPEADNPEDDLNYLKLKLDQGGDFVITQLFFDNRLYHDFVRQARSIGIRQPIIPGILPVVSLNVIKRIVSLCGATIPADYLAQLEDADRRGGAAEVEKLGIVHARRQAQELLASGVPGVHLYTLNRAEVILELADGLLP